jgi:TIGR03009 family protein
MDAFLLVSRTTERFRDPTAEFFFVSAGMPTMPRRINRLLPIALIIVCALASVPKATAQTAAGQPAQGPAQYPQTQQPGPQRVAGPQAPVQGPPQAPQPPRAPFQLTPQQHSQLMSVLQAWEARSNKITTLSCTFTRWDYNPVFGMKNPAKNPNDPTAIIPKESHGVLKYAAPDKGLYQIEEIVECVGFENGQPKYEKREEGGEHWVCDGVAIWEYNYQKEQLIERRLPPAMQGKAISDGPLPFLFGADADKLMQRYFMRVITPPNVRDQIWLEAYPKYAMDAGNFSRATLILDQKTMLPFAIEVSLPNGKERHVHQFSNNVVNNLFRFFQGNFAKPALPRGWTKVEEPATPPPVSSLPGPQRG